MRQLQWSIASSIPDIDIEDGWNRLRVGKDGIEAPGARQESELMIKEAPLPQRSSR